MGEKLSHPPAKNDVIPDGLEELLYRVTPVPVLEHPKVGADLPVRQNVLVVYSGRKINLGRPAGVFRGALQLEAVEVAVAVHDARHPVDEVDVVLLI